MTKLRNYKLKSQTIKLIFRG